MKLLRLTRSLSQSHFTRRGIALALRKLRNKRFEKPMEEA